MQVVAKKSGYYNHRLYKEGESFNLKEIKGVNKDGEEVVFSIEQQFSKKWMEKPGKEEQVHSGKKKKHHQEPENEDVI